MIWLEKMDTVLGCLYDNSGKNPTFVLIMSLLADKQIDKGEVEDILLYLYRKGFIYCEKDGNRDYGYVDHPDAHYLISCEGKLFWEGAGGFVKKDRKEKLEADIMKTDLAIRKNNEKLLSRGTVWLAVGTFLLVAAEILIHWDELVHLF